MVRFYQADKKQGGQKAFEVTCESLDILGRGVCKKDGIVYFVENLLPNETARIVPILNKDKNNKVSEAKVTKLIFASSARCEQDCLLQGQCGGCPLEHIDPKTALQAKVEGVSKLLIKSVIQGTKSALSAKASIAKGSSKLGKNSTIKQVLAQKHALTKNSIHREEISSNSIEASEEIKSPSFIISYTNTKYRRACRLSLRTDHGKVHLGFRENKTQELVPISDCKVLTERNNALLIPLKELINKLEYKKHIGHVELLDTDGAVGILFRMTKLLPPRDESLLLQFAKESSIEVVFSVLEPYKLLDDTEQLRERFITQSNLKESSICNSVNSCNNSKSNNSSNSSACDKNCEITANPLIKGSHRLFVYSNDCKIYCSPSSFVQVNKEINKSMVDKVLQEVAPFSGQKVLDLFSGLGNFSIPIAKAGAGVVGIDIVSDMVKQAQVNATLNGISEAQAKFHVANLEEPFEAQIWAKDQYDVVVMDPGRMGAKRAVAYMAKLKPKKIIMISCNPLATARDTVQLLSANYKLKSWGAFDMFPRTTHVEIMLVFELAD